MLEERKHSWVSFDPFFESNGYSEGRGAWRRAIRSTGRGGSYARCILPSNESQNYMFHGIDGS